MGLFKALYEKGQTIVMITHNPENAKFSTRTILLKDGRMVSLGENPVQQHSLNKDP